MGGSSEAAPPPSTTTQQIGSDRLSQTLANRGQGFARTGPRQAEQLAERQGFRGLAGAGAAGGLTQAGTGQLLDTIQGGGFAALPGQLEAITNPAIRNLQRSTLPSISNEFAQSAGSGSGNEFGAIVDAQEGVAGQIAAQGAQLQGQERDRQFGAAQFFPQAQQAAAQTGLSQIQGGGTSLSRNAQLASLLPALRTTTTTGAGQQAQSSSKGQGVGNLAGTAAGLYFSGGNPAVGAAAGQAGGSLGGSFD